MMKRFFNNLLDCDYKSTAEMHYLRCGFILERAKHVTEMFWAALELRMCLERLSLEYLVLLTHEKLQLSKKEIKRYQPGDIIPRLLQEAPFFEKTVDFVNAVFKASGHAGEMKFPDLQWSDTTYGRLSNYLHCQRDPLTQEELLKFADFVHTSWKEARVYVVTRANIGKLRPHAEEIFGKYVNDEIDHAQMERMIKLSNIPLHLQNPE